jgi:proton glutamate symport protein
VIFAFALSRIDPGKRNVALAFFEAVADALLIVIGWVLWIAPAGVLALSFAVGAGAGGAALGAVAHYVVLISLLGVGVTLVAYLIALVVARFRPVAFLRAMAGPSAVAISTRSSLASLPAMLKAAERLGVDEGKANVLLPMAVALFRATGPAMNVGVAMYVAHWLGVEVTPWNFAAGVAVATMASVGAVSLPGQVSFVTSIGPISLAMGVPIEPLALLIALETIPDIFRTLGNVTADVAVTGAVARQEGDTLTDETDAEAGHPA